MATATGNKSTQTNGFGRAAMFGAAGAGAALGMLAMVGRKFAVQAPTMMAGPWDEALAAEHRLVLAAFDKLEATDDAETSKRTLLLAQIKHALAKHALEEENVVYPAMRDAGLADDADELNKEHGYVKQHLYDLEAMPKNSPQFIERVRRFRADLEHHMTEEENELFPKLKAKLGDEESRTITAQMNKEGLKLA